LTTSGNVIFPERTTVTVGGGGVRLGCAVEPQPTTPRNTAAANIEHAGSRRILAASLVVSSDMRIMSVLFNQSSHEAPVEARMGKPTYTVNQRQLSCGCTGGITLAKSLRPFQGLNRSKGNGTINLK
jgi:hypothetical protein